MKKRITKYISFIIAGALALGVCSCEKSGNDGDKETETSVSENTTPAESSSAKQTTSYTFLTEPEASETTLEAPEPAHDVEYVTLNTVETGFGNITYPVINTEMLDKSDAEAANALFEQIKSAIESNIEEYLAAAPEEAAGGLTRYDLCSSYYSVNAGVLSVLVRYEYYFGYPVTHQCSVNFDLNTGKAMTPDEVIEYSGYTNENVEEALIWYAETSLTNNYKIAELYNCYYGETLPDDNYVDMEGWLDLYEDVLAKYHGTYDGMSGSEFEGENAWESLTLSPVVYFSDMGELYVEGAIPTSTVGEIYNAMVQVGYDRQHTERINRLNAFDPIWPVQRLTPQGAAEAASNYINADYPAAFEVEGLEYLIDNEGYGHVVYTLHAFTDEGDHTATVGRYAVDPIENYIWETDSAGEWQMAGYIPNPLPLPESDALGLVLLEATEYEAWLAYPANEVFVSGDPEYILIEAVYDGTEVSVLSGKMNEDGSFSGGSLEYQAALNAGDWVKIYCGKPPEGEPELAIEFATGFDKGTFIYQYSEDDIKENGRARCVFPDND